MSQQEIKAWRKGLTNKSSESVTWEDVPNFPETSLLSWGVVKVSPEVTFTRATQGKNALLCGEELQMPLLSFENHRESLFKTKWEVLMER